MIPMKSTRTAFNRILMLILTAWPLAATLAAEASARKPNVIVILADDLGYGDVGVHGCKDIPTPNIDAFARSGIRFSSGYVSAPLCGPTRAALMTGRYQSRFGHEFNPPAMTEPNPAKLALDLRETTFADRMKRAGYITEVAPRRGR